MTKFIFPLFIATVTLSSAFADISGPMGPGRGRFNDDLPMCLKNLDNANRRADTLQLQLNSCLEDSRGGQDSGELERLRQDNQLLSENNNRLLRENRDLRRQLGDLQGTNRSLGFFSYAGCKTYQGSVNLSYIASAIGKGQLEAETLAEQNLKKSFSCTYGIAVKKTEEIRTTQANNYCVAGCTDYQGTVNAEYIASGTGRNITEAQFNALKAVSSSFSCTYGMAIKACQ